MVCQPYSLDASLIRTRQSDWNQKKGLERELEIIWSYPSNVCIFSIIHREKKKANPLMILFCILELP